MYGEPKKYTQLRLYQSIIEAEKIVVGNTRIFRIDENSDEILFELNNVEIIFEAHSLKNNSPLFVQSDKTVYEDSPIIVPEKPHLLFLKTAIKNKGLLKTMELDDSTIIYVVCNGWQSSTCLDFLNVKSLASKLLEDRYHIKEASELINVVKELSLWKLNIKQEKKVDILLKCFTKSDSAIYTDNILQMVSYLGGKVFQKEGSSAFDKPVRDKPDVPAADKLKQTAPYDVMALT